MAKNKVSEWSSTPSNNTDVGGIDIAEGCAPSGINNAMREIMSQVKNFSTGADGGDLAISGTFLSSGTLNTTGSFLLDGASGSSGQVLLSAGSGNTPVWGNAFVAGMIMLWSGSIATIPSGWLLCDGSNGTPDLRDRFVIGAGSNYSVAATGGSKDAIVVSHTHTATVTDTGHTHSPVTANNGFATASSTTPFNRVGETWSSPTGTNLNNNVAIASATTGISVGISTTGSSGTNANLPPYYALAYIMKA